MTVILHQFPYSHFNEKARWALDLKDVEHTRIGYLPGPHVPAMKKLSGHSQTPVLDWHGEIIPGSAAIIEFLEEKVPAPTLFPEEHRSAIRELCEELDGELGPATRSLVFSGLINESAYTADMFSSGKPSLTRFFYRWTFPLVKPLIKKANGVNPENLANARKIVARQMDEIHAAAAGTGYLVGGTFTAADLTAAALLAPIASVQHPDMARPQPVPDGVQKVINEFKDHPAVDWTNSIYAKHR